MLTRLDRPLLTLSAAAHVRLIEDLAGKRISGGAAHDALIGATAEEHDHTLMTADRRAAATYEAIGARSEFVDL